MKQKNDSLAETGELKRFIISLDDFVNWLQQVSETCSVEDLPQSLSEAEAMLDAHFEVMVSYFIILSSCTHRILKDKSYTSWVILFGNKHELCVQYRMLKTFVFQMFSNECYMMQCSAMYLFYLLHVLYVAYVMYALYINVHYVHHT